MKNTDVVVEFRVGHEPSVQDYFDRAMAADAYAERMNRMNTEKGTKYRRMSAQAAQDAGAFVSIPTRFLDKYL